MRKIVYPIFFIILLFTAKLYFDRIGSFSFGDEYNNFIPGFFMQKGRILHAQIFFNHQILMVYIDYLLQIIFNPKTLYQLVFIHRFFVIVFSFLISIVLIIRFKYAAAGVLIFYELTKYFLFGNLFLAESLIVYPLMYLFFLTWEKIQKEKIHSCDMIISSIFVWFVVFMREPYIPLALVLFFIILWKKRLNTIDYFSIILCFLLSIITLLPVPIKDFFDQVILFNLKTTVPGQQAGVIKFFEIVFYPLYIFFTGQWNMVRIILISFSAIFIFLVGWNLCKLKQYRQIAFIFLILTLANLRPVSPATLFYEAFHMLVWYSMFLTAIFLLVEQIYRTGYKKIFFFLCFLLLCIFCFIISPNSFIWEKIDKNLVFNENYAHHYVNGEVIKVLSQPDDTLFADQWDYLLYWQAGLDSAYQYGVFTFIMHGNQKYEHAKKQMMIKNPPDFYYTYHPHGICNKNVLGSSQNFYNRLYSKDTHVCMYIKQEKIKQISQIQWQKAKELGFYLQ